MELQTITGEIDRVIYTANSGYAVVSLSTGSDEITVTGELGEPAVGESLRVTGQWVDHPKYGRQFKAESACPILPSTIAGLKRYLGSGNVKHIGEVRAHNIVTTFGLDTFRILDDDFDRLANVHGIGPLIAEKIRPEWEKNKASRAVMLALAELGVTASLSSKAHKHFGDGAASVIRANPYRLTEIHGVGFVTADATARKLGFPPDSPARIQAGLLHALDQSSGVEGHVYVPDSILTGKAAELLQVPVEQIGPEITTLHRTQKVIAESLFKVDPQANGGRAVYLPALHRAETGLARRVLEIGRAQASEEFGLFGTLDWDKALSATGLELADMQRQAVVAALTGKITVLTGGPGTGKTTTLRAILDLCDEHEIRYALCAPTGRAAKRMSEASGGREASTIHRLLGYTFEGGQMRFDHDEHYPLKADLVVVDEASMLDLSLAYHLFKAIPNGAHALLVGDVDQLPSVGAGNVLRDLIGSEAASVVCLDVIFRQAQDSQIIANAHRINRGEMPHISNSVAAGDDFYFFTGDDPAQTADLVVDLVQNRIPRKFGLDQEDIMVLSPMRRGQAGVNNLNTLLQAALNPPDGDASGEAERSFGTMTLRVGDKVMQVRNDYDREVFNGDLGTVVQFDLDETKIAVDFDGQLVSYDFGDVADNLVLAYASTIHKSQGSEYPCVVVPLLTQHYVMLQRNLVYTAITRAEELVVIVGSRKALAMAVRNDKVARRHSGLLARLADGR